MADNGVAYNVSVIPRVPIMKFSGTSVELRVSYNISYNVTVLATLCGQGSTNSTLQIYFGKFLCSSNGLITSVVLINNLLQ